MVHGARVTASTRIQTKAGLVLGPLNFEEDGWMDVAGFGGFIVNLQRGSTGRRSFRRIPACARVLLALCYFDFQTLC